jgi:DNA mismatch repair protein MutS
MMRQYKALKRKSGDAVLFFRLGDFYEMFEKDAREVSALLNLTLTKRNGIPMCGIPYHASQGYIARLLRLGKKIAICEQITLPAGGKGIAERDIVETITPGTVFDEDFLESKRNNYLAALGIYRNTLSFSYMDCSTGEFAATCFSEKTGYEDLGSELARLLPREILVQESAFEESPYISRLISEYPSMLPNRFPDWNFDITDSYRKLTEQFGTVNLKGFGIGPDDPALYTVGVLLDYIKESSKSLLPHIRGIARYTLEEYLTVDETTQKNLEIVRNIQDGSGRYTLLETLDSTKTAMGGRKLRYWLTRPLVDAREITRRLDRVELFYRQQMLLNSFREILGSVLDLERLASRLATDKAHAKDLLGIRNSLDRFFELLSLQGDWQAKELLSDIGGDTRKNLEEVKGLIDSAIHEDPSVLLSEGKLIKEGYSAELDGLRELKSNSKKVLDDYLSEEKKKTGINNLKVKYNKIIGHFLEVSKANTELVPEYFIRRQSLVNSERYTTEELGELEVKLNNAVESIVDKEREIFLDIRGRIKKRIDDLLESASIIAEIDCLASFAYSATAYGYTRPRIDDSDRLRIEAGRHPVVEKHLPPGDFVPNGLDIDPRKQNLVLLTGPNMAGKSTYLRQTALIVLMAQAGSFVPAGEARIGIVDRIFCRVGASDNLARGESTFLVEMNETANILRAATPDSLIIMDEVGRGTSTQDGLSIAQAVCEHILEVLGTKALFATHYHELTDLDHPKLVNISMDVAERDGTIVFLKSVVPGPSSNSYGIHVAELAGLPAEVITRAQILLRAQLNDSGLPLKNSPATASTKDAGKSRLSGENSGQSELFDPGELVIREIESLSLDTMTPLEALNTIAAWKRKLDG